MKPQEISVADLMSTMVITIGERAPIAEAVERMHADDIRHLPVVDDGGRIVGILSDRDLRGADPAESVAQRMTEDPLTVQPETLAYEATALMLDRKVGALPVTDRSGRVVGVITETDFLRVAHRALGGDRLSIEHE